jgi:phosphatidylserine/phosphatidylglycerophosphate/cardiolipin synthase-like enzyme
VVRLIVQPDDGVMPLVLAMQRARRTLDLPIFRLDHDEIDRALKSAVKRGVVVRTLIAHTAKGAERALRKLEQRLLATGATVSRSDDDLMRYHYKILIVDRELLFVMGFNYTRLDIDRSRSMGLVTRNAKLVQEALKLFEADFDRKPYMPALKDFVVSPINSRTALSALLRGAKRQLLIYDENVTDNAMLEILRARAEAGVEIRILGRIEKPQPGVQVEKYPGTLHLRAIIQDGRRAFIGSQSLRRPELEGRREVGVVFKDARIVGQMMRVFEEDWLRTPSGEKLAAKLQKHLEQRSRGRKAS